MGSGQERTPWEDWSPQGHRVHALCIGVSDYTVLDKLPNAEKDAKSIAQCVEESGRSKTQIVDNPVRRYDMTQGVKNFVSKVDKDRPPRIVLVFYAGHGMQHGDAIYMLPTNANPKTPELLKSQGMSHDELFRMLKKGINDKIQVGNVLYLVIFDSCRESLEGSEVVAGYSPEIHEPLSENRPEYWLLCTSTSRRAVAYDGNDGDLNSPFTQALMSVECGLFQPNVPLDQALKLICKRLDRLGEQKPGLMHAQNIPDSLCLHESRRERDTTEDKPFDVCLCYREGGPDSALAESLRDKIECCDVQLRGSEKRRLRVYLEAGPAPPAAKIQAANAIFGSTVILLLVSRDTLSDINTLQEDSQAKDWLVQLLWKYEMALELFDAGQHTVVPLLTGHKSEIYGRNSFEMFDASDKHEEFWHLQKIPNLKIKAIVKNALDGLRCNAQFAKNLNDEMLVHDACIPSIIRGRSVKQSIIAFSSIDTFTPWKFEGIQDDAISKICRELTVLVESVHERRKRDRSCLDDERSGAASKIPKRGYAGVSSRVHHDAGEGSSSKRQKVESTSANDCNDVGGEIGAGRLTDAHVKMIQWIDEIRKKSTSMALPLFDNTSDHFDLMISYRVNTEENTASRIYDKIMLAPSPTLAQMGNRRCKIPEYARADCHTGALDPGIARTFLDQKHIPQGRQREQVFFSACANSLVFVPLLSWYEEEGKSPSGSVGELMMLHHNDRVDYFLLEIIIANSLMCLPVGHRWLQRISPIFIGKAVARGYTNFPFANVEKLPDVPSFQTCKKAAEILMNDLRIPVDTIVMAFSVKEHIDRLIQCQGVNLSDLGQEDKALQIASKNLIDQVPALQQILATKMHEVLRNELQTTASSISRLNSPATSDLSGADTEPQSPQSPRPFDTAVMHINQEVSEFRDDMRKFMQDFCADSREQPRKWRLCELLLVAFFRDKVAPSCDAEISENLETWQEACGNPDVNLTDEFNQFMTLLKPPILKELDYKFAQENKQNHTSIFVIDWLVQQSPWALTCTLQHQWVKEKVVLQWFDPNNSDSADNFLERAETFLQRGTQKGSWGVKILRKVIETNSYVVFFRMDALASLLIREYCELQKSRDTHQLMQEDSVATVEKKQSAMPIAISLIVSSSNWHSSFENHSDAHVSEIAWRLRRIARLPAELLEENACSMHKANFVDCEPLYNLETAKKSEPVPILLAIPSAASGGAANASEMMPGSTVCTHDQLLKLFNDNIGIVQSYLREFSQSCGQYEDSASGSIMKIDKTCMFVKPFLSRTVDPFNGVMPATQYDVGHGQNAAGHIQNPENVHERIQRIESNRRKGAEGEEERRMFLRRMGYGVNTGANALAHDVHGNGNMINSAQKLLHMLLKGQFLCLLGPPACGKTVTMLQVACAAAAAVQKCVDRGLVKGVLPPRIPLFMRASELSTLVAASQKQHMSMESLVKQFIAHKYPHAKCPNVARVLEEFLKLRRVLIIIDGLDEAAGNRSRIEHFIDKLAAANDVCLMISTRDYAFETSRMEDRLCEFESARIHPLDEEQRQFLIRGRLSDCREASQFCAQLDLVSRQTPEMATNPFLLALMIEVFKKDGNHTIPTRRCDLYDKQVEGILIRHQCLRHLVDPHFLNSTICPSLLDITAHRIYHDTENSLYRQAKSDFRCLEALRKSLCANRGDDMDIENDFAAQLNVVSLREFLEVFAFVCQIKLKRRDFEWDSEEMQAQMQEIWSDSERSLTDVSRFLLDLSSVGLLSKVGDGQFRFSHLTLQEYLAASCAVRLFGDDPQNLLNQLRPLHSRWNREVLQFTSCMPQLRDEMFEEFCQLVLQGDDGTGAHCELVQDFLKGREVSVAVHQKMRDKLHEIRGTDSLVAGLCHPSLELRNRVLSEMKLFLVPSDPFSQTDGIVAILKQIAEDHDRAWYERAAAIVSVAQIAQMDHCQMGTGRNDTLRWVLDMLGSATHEDLHFVLVTSLGTFLKGSQNDEAGDDCIMLASQDELQVLNFLNHAMVEKEYSHMIGGLSEALADLKAYSDVLVDWVLDQKLIDTGEWLLKHALLFCEKTAAAANVARATRLCKQLLGRAHVSSVETFERENGDLLKGLNKMLAVVGPNGLSVVLPFFDIGQVHLRVRMLCIAADLNLQFARPTLGDLAQSLLSDAGEGLTHQSVLTNFMEQEYIRYSSKNEHMSLGEASSAFRYLQTVMEPAVADGFLPQQVADEMNEFEMQRMQVREREQESERELERDRQRERKEAPSTFLDSVPVPLMPKSHKKSEKDALKESKQEVENLSLETLAVAVKIWTPKMLKSSIRIAANPLNLYCAARLWQTSGLIERHDVDKRAPLSESQSLDAEDAFENLCSLRDPWMAGYCNMMQDKVLGLGRLLFSMVLLHIQKTIQGHPDAAMDKLKLLETRLEQWQSSDELSGDAAQQLEHRFLLKELRIGCRSQQLPTWAGRVSARPVLAPGYQMSHGNRQKDFIGPRFALTLGNGHYKSGHFGMLGPVCRKDAQAMQHELQKLSFEVRKEEDAGKAVFEKAFDEWVENMVKQNSKCVALFHASCHGVEVDNQNYLVPVDATKFDVSSCSHSAEKKCKQCLKDEVREKCISLQGLLDELIRRLPDGSLVIFFLDCCRDDPCESKSLNLKGGVDSKFVKLVIQPHPNVVGEMTTTTFVGYATEAGKTAAANAAECDGYSPFTYALLDCLKNANTAHCEIEELFRSVRALVQNVTRGGMNPDSQSNLTKGFRFLQTSPSQGGGKSAAATEDADALKVASSNWSSPAKRAKRAVDAALPACHHVAQLTSGGGQRAVGSHHLDEVAADAETFRGSAHKQRSEDAAPNSNPQKRWSTIDLTLSDDEQW